MTHTKLTSLVTEAVALDRDVREKVDRLTGLKDLLKQEASTRNEEHAATETGGWSWTAAGTDGCIARVTQEGGKLKSAISSDKDLAKLREIAGPLFTQLFEPRVSYKPLPGIRDRAAQLLGKAAGKLLKAITGSGQTNVAFETKESI